MHLKIFRWITDRPSIVSVVAFVPPAVEDAHIEDTVHRGFLSAPSAGFQRRSWIVQPYVDSLREEMRGVHLVVLDERYMPREPVVGGERVDLVNEMFSVFVGRVRLSGKDDLNGAPLIEHHRLDAIQVVEKQGGAFIPSEPACEADGKSFGIEQRSHGDDLPGIDPITRPAVAGAFSCESQELSLEKDVNVPDFFVRNIHDAIPEGNVIVPVDPFRAEISIE